MPRKNSGVDPGLGRQSDDPTSENSEGEKCEMIVIDSRVDDRGDRVQFKYNLGDQFDVTQRHLPSRGSALSLIRFFSAEQPFDSARLEIRSNHVREVLAKYIKHLPNVFWGDEAIRIMEPPYCLFHCLSSLEEEKSQMQTSSPSWAHLDLLLKYITNRFADSIVIHDDHKLQSRMDATIDYENLWTIFSPGIMLYQRSMDSSDIVSRLEQIHSDNNKIWNLTILNIEVDINGYHWHRSSCQLAQFAQFKRINSLEIYPLTYHQDEQAVAKRLQERRQIYASIQKGQQMLYDGILWSYRSTEPSPSSFKSSGRIILDIPDGESLEIKKDLGPLHHVLHHIGRIAPPDEVASVTKAPNILDHGGLITSSPLVTGYSLLLKQWYKFRVDSLKKIDFDKTTFETLPMPRHHRDRLYRLVDCTSRNSLQAIGNQSYLILLYGPSGSGKSHTIRALADFGERPLMIINLGDLGGDIKGFGENLQSTLLQAQKWSTIIVINNAEWYFAEEHQNNSSQSTMASILLHYLTQYPGLIFLNARQNLASSDLQSHLSLSIQFELLTSESQKSLWRSILNSYGIDVDISTSNDEDSLTLLASCQLDAWQIKNTINSANIIAASENAPLLIDIIIQELKHQGKLSSDQESCYRSNSRDVDTPSGRKHGPKKRKRTTPLPSG